MLEPFSVALPNSNVPFTVSPETLSTDPLVSSTRSLVPSITPPVNDAPFIAVRFPPLPCSVLPVTSAPSNTSDECAPMEMIAALTLVASVSIKPCSTSGTVVSFAMILPALMNSPLVMFALIVPPPSITPLLISSPPAGTCVIVAPTPPLPTTSVPPTEPAPIASVEPPVNVTVPEVPPKFTPSNVALVAVRLPWA